MTTASQSPATPPQRSTFYVCTDRKPLGTGTYGTVYHGIDQTTNEPVAVKLMTKSTLKPVDIEAAHREAAMLRKVDAHPNLLRLCDAGEDQTFIYVVTPVVSGGDLKDHLSRGAAYDEDAARALLRNLLSAVAHMHDQGVMHRDIKLENILLRPSPDAVDGTPSTDPVLIDFGFATDETRPTNFCGTPYYLAPEVIDAGQKKHCSYDRKCDVWSVGVVAYMLLQQGAKPFSGADVFGCFREIRANRPPWDFECSPAARAFVESLLITDPVLRPAARDALNHPWLRGDALPRTVQPDAAPSSSSDVDDETKHVQAEMGLPSSATRARLPRSQSRCDMSRTLLSPSEASARFHSDSGAASVASASSLDGSRRMPAPNALCASYQRDDDAGASQSSFMTLSRDPKQLL